MAAAALLLTGCTSDEQRRMDRLAGTYVLRYAPGQGFDKHVEAQAMLRAMYADSSPGLTGEVDRHALTLSADGAFTTEHSTPAMQQFDVPMANGSYRVLDPTTIVLRFVLVDASGEDGVADSQKYTVSNDTLFPQTSERMRMGERVTSMSAHVGEATYLLKQR